MSTHLPPPFNTSPPESLTLIAQGAEAVLYRTNWWDDATTTTSSSSSSSSSADPSRPPTQVALKVRPPKPWRHPLLDRRLTRQRILAEARVLAKCRRDAVPVPAVYAVDWEAGWSVVEWIEGRTVKAAIRERRSLEHDKSGERGEGEEGGGGGGEEEGKKDKEEDVVGEEREKEELRSLLRRIGSAVGRLHAAGVIHGDLTTSNMLLRRDGGEEGGGGGGGSLSGEIVLIDFGLAVQAVQEEDRAVDLYVLERAFGSTHPREEESFGEVLRAYEGCYKGAKATLKRLEDVRMRGRKKSMIG